MIDLGASASRHSRVLALVERVTRLLDGIPYTLLALPLRAGAAVVLWNSAMAKLARRASSASRRSRARTRIR